MMEVQFRCCRCKTRIVAPITAALDPEHVHQCPNCSTNLQIKSLVHVVEVGVAHQPTEER